MQIGKHGRADKRGVDFPKLHGDFSFVIIHSVYVFCVALWKKNKKKTRGRNFVNVMRDRLLVNLLQNTARL